MRIVIGTTRPFHLFHLADELCILGHDVELFSYIPERFVSRYGTGRVTHKSLFQRNLFKATCALQSQNLKLQAWATGQLLVDIDIQIAQSMPECDVYIGLSGMCVKSLGAAKSLGAIAICDRGSTHVLNQQRALLASQGAQLTEEYVQREIKAYHIANYIMVPSKFAYDSFLAEGLQPHKLLQNSYGVDLSRFYSSNDCTMHPERPEQGKPIRLIFVGAWSFRKGCDLLSELLDLDDNLEICHVGLPGDVDFPKSGRFRSLGHVDNDQLVSVYRSSHIMVLPSREDGFGMVLLEALAAGVPVVASKFCAAPDLRDLLTHGEATVNVIEELSAEGILRSVIRTVESVAGLGTSLLSRADFEYLTWQAYGKRYAQTLERIVYQGGNS